MRSCSLALLFGAGFVLPAFGDWLTDAGFPALQAEMGGSLPTGAGIPVLISEANVATLPTITYLLEGTAGSVPFTGTGEFAGKTITPHSGPSATSGHAQAVASNFIGNTASLTPGITEVHAWLADDFLNEIYSNPPASLTGSVQNHSWVGSTGSASTDTELLRRLDYVIERDGPTVITPMNNGAGMSALQANAYHSLSVGLLNDNHPHTQSTLDTTGRMKPDLVVDQGFTSFAGPCVASAAVLLLDLIRPGYPDADDPRVVKALLLAGATKANLPGWHRAATSKPYDNDFGAGELNILNPVHILMAGRQPASDSIARSSKGWDNNTASPITPRRYFFTIPAGRWANTFSAALTWHRQLNLTFATSTLNNLNLRLSHANGFSVGSMVDESISSIDNVEHLFLRNLEAGDYVLEVTTDFGADSYGIAWEAQLGNGPAITFQRSGSTNTVGLLGIDPFITYTIEASTDLLSWTPGTTVRTADTTPAFTAQWTDTVTGVRAFYRLRW